MLMRALFMVIGIEDLLFTISLDDGKHSRTVWVY